MISHAFVVSATVLGIWAALAILILILFHKFVGKNISQAERDYSDEAQMRYLSAYQMRQDLKKASPADLDPQNYDFEKGERRS